MPRKKDKFLTDLYKRSKTIKLYNLNLGYSYLMEPFGNNEENSKNKKYIANLKIKKENKESVEALFQGIEEVKKGIMETIKEHHGDMDITTKDIKDWINDGDSKANKDNDYIKGYFLFNAKSYSRPALFDQYGEQMQIKMDVDEEGQKIETEYFTTQSDATERSLMDFFKPGYPLKGVIVDILPYKGMSLNDYGLRYMIQGIAFDSQDVFEKPRIDYSSFDIKKEKTDDIPF